MKPVILALLSALTVALSACSSLATPTPAATAPQAPSIATQPATPSEDPSETGSDLTRVDQQGAVVIEITPLYLDNPADTLAFDVLMDTHSVDLSMDLAPLATLASDTGVRVKASLWDAPRGGHHLTGKLIFPSAAEGRSVLEGASTLTLTIVNVDADARTFEWDLN
jgi:hypothetical protein